MSLSECFDGLIDEIRNDVTIKNKSSVTPDEEEIASGGEEHNSLPHNSDEEENLGVYPETRESDAYSKRINYLKTLKQN